MLKDDLHMSPYKIYVIQELSEDVKKMELCISFIWQVYCGDNHVW
jgi:hypothetical protein